MGEPLKHPSAGAHDTTESESADETRAALDALSRASAEAEALLRDVLELSKLRWERARAEVRSGAFAAVVGLGAYLAGIAVSIVAAFYLLDGLAEGAGLALGAPWAGRAIVGGGALLLLVVALLAARAAMRRANLRRLRDKFESGADR